MKFQTKCESCVFKETENGEQVGCSVGRLEKYLEKDKAEKTEDGNYVINTVCNMCKRESWVKDGEDLASMKARARSDANIQNDFIIVGKPDSTIEDFISKTKEIVRQKILPRVIIFSVCDIPIYSKLRGEVEKYIDIERTHVLINMAFSSSLDSRIFESALRTKHTFFSVFMVDEEIPENFNSKLDELINDELRVISAIIPENGYHGLTIQKMLFKKITQNATTGIDYVVEEIKEVAKETNEERMLLTWQEMNQE